METNFDMTACITGFIALAWSAYQQFQLQKLNKKKESNP